MNYEFFEDEINMFHGGMNAYSYRFLGCHRLSAEGSLRFSVWAPNAVGVSLVGEWNDWDVSKAQMKKVDPRGIWSIVTDDPKEDMFYKYGITTQTGKIIFKADPFAFAAELRPGTASRIKTTYDHVWHDDEWLNKRKTYKPYIEPMSIYEMHLGSWTDADNYTDIADELIPYLKKMNFTHVEFMPLAEFPFDGSWGYQSTGYFAPTSRYGDPEGLMYLIDSLHQAGIGALIDWVPAHFPKDAFALARFDGGMCFESSDPLMSEHPEWGTLIFDCEKGEVKSFLISSAIYWLERFHFDGLRADAVSSMIYLDYGRSGRFSPNKHGGRENLEAIDFLRKTSEIIFRDFPGTIFAAEEATAFPLVTMPTYMGGLGFNYKWNMGWMHDMLDYMSTHPSYRHGIQNKLTFSMYYAFSENYILPISHDEVVHGKRSLLDRMPGNIEQKFANLRAFLMFMFVHPGKKLLFMGAEIGEFIEWRYYEPLEWHLLQYDNHKKLQSFVANLNAFYKATPALYQIEDDWDGFKWLNTDDVDNCSVSLIRTGKSSEDMIAAVFNYSENGIEEYRLGVPFAGKFTQTLFSNDSDFSGDGLFSNGCVCSENVPWNGEEQSIVIKLAPLSGYYFKVEQSSYDEALLNADSATKYLISDVLPANSPLNVK